MKKLTLISILIIILTTFFSCKSNKDIDKKGKVKISSEYQFDGFKLGDNFKSKVMNRNLYNDICDDDPIDKKSRTFILYGAKPCRNKTFQDKTSVMFYLKYSKNDNFNQPIEAFSYLGGTYYNKRSDFPFKPGDKLKDITKFFGKPVTNFTIKGRKYILNVYKFSGDIYAICDRDNETAIGFAFGKLPSDPNNEQWRAVMQIYRRYTYK